MPERQPAPGETDENATASPESPPDAGTPATNSPAPRPVMPSPKPRGSGHGSGAGVGETVVAGSVPPRPDRAEPDAGGPTTGTGATDEQPAVAASTAGPARPQETPPGSTRQADAVPGEVGESGTAARPTTAVPPAPAQPRPGPSAQAATGGTSGSGRVTEGPDTRPVDAPEGSGPSGVTGGTGGSAGSGPADPSAAAPVADGTAGPGSSGVAGGAAAVSGPASASGARPAGSPSGVQQPAAEQPASAPSGTPDGAPTGSPQPESRQGPGRPGSPPGAPQPPQPSGRPQPGGPPSGVQPDGQGQPAAAQSGYPQPGTPRPDSAWRGSPQHGGPAQRPSPPGTQPPGTQPPGAQQPGAQPPGAQPPGARPFTPQPQADGESVADTARVQAVPPRSGGSGIASASSGSGPGAASAAAPGEPGSSSVTEQPTNPSTSSAAGPDAAGTAALPARDVEDRSTTAHASAGQTSTTQMPTAQAPTAGVPGSTESTQVLRTVGAEPATERLYGGPAADGPGGAGPVDPGSTERDPDGGRPRRRGLLVAGAIVAVLVLGYLADLLFSSGSVPRGVVVAGQEIGGMSRAAAIEMLQGAIEPRSSQPIQVTAGEVRSEVDPRAAGLAVDYDGTLDEAGAQPLNPITRVTSFFATRDVPVVNKSDERSVRASMEELAPVVDRDPKDGTVRFDGVNPVPVAPEPGQRLDVDAAVGTLEARWADGVPVALPLIVEQPTTTPEDVQQAIDEVARPAVSAPLTVTGEGANATVEPTDIAEALTFKADPAASPKLVPQINVESLTDVVKPQLASTEKPAVDASLNLAVTPAAVIPSVDGRGIDYKASFADLVPVLTGTGPRSVAAVYAPKPADLTTSEIQSLGNATEISSFTTRGFARDSGVNIRRAAEAIDGAIVAPGETFSLDDTTNPRDASRGYVDAGIIEDGAPSRGVGGGVSQLATTLYNASYFAGMVDVEHKEHSYYISRYPVAREATVFDNIIDLKFRNDGPTPVLIRTAWTPNDITVKFLGQKMYEVTSQTGPRTNPTSPQNVTIPPGRPCSPSKGSPGFTATDTKTTRNLQTGETTSRTRTVRYNPQPIVQCG